MFDSFVSIFRISELLCAETLLDSDVREGKSLMLLKFFKIKDLAIKIPGEPKP